MLGTVTEQSKATPTQQQDPNANAPIPPIAPQQAPTMQPMQQTQTTQQAPPPPAFQYQRQPTVQDYINEARKLGQEQILAFNPIIQQQADEAGKSAMKRLIGQNVDLSSGVGKDIVGKQLKPIFEQQAAQANALGAQLGSQALQQYQQADYRKQDQDIARANNIITMIQSGGYTPTEADRAFLASQGYTGDVATMQSDNQRLNTLLGLIQSGGYTPTESDKAFLSSKGIGGELGSVEMNQQRLSNLLSLIQQGNYTPTEADKAFLVSQGLGGKLVSLPSIEIEQRFGRKEDGTAFTSQLEAEEYWAQRGFNRDLVNQYGINPATGKPWASEQEALLGWKTLGFREDVLLNYGLDPRTGKPFTSPRAAEDYWEGQNFNREIVQRFGIDPNTGKPFLSEQEGLRYYEKVNNLDGLDLQQRSALQKIALAYGVKPDGTMFGSENEAKEFWNKKEIENKFGLDPRTGQQFGSENDAIDYWDQRGFDKKILQKYGISDSGIPFTNEEQAIAFWKAKGFEQALIEKYGIGPDGKPPKTEQEGQAMLDAKELDRLKLNIEDKAIADRINDLQEWQYYMENGRTYEDEIADIIDTSKTLDQWKSSLPKIQAHIARLDERIAYEAVIRKGETATARYRMEQYKEQREILNSMVREIQAGVIPTQGLDYAGFDYVAQQLGQEQPTLPGQEVIPTIQQTQQDNSNIPEIPPISNAGTIGGQTNPLIY
jgi:hypothetical protein